MKVSIVLPTRNGAATLPAVLDAISRQRVDFHSRSLPSTRRRRTGPSTCFAIASIGSSAFLLGI
jgi:hypothetical protein